MCGRCEDGKDVMKNENGLTRRTFVFLVLFSLTLSALGISCFALLTVQNLSRDLDTLRLVLRRSRVELSKQHAYGFNNVEQADLSVGLVYETPVKTETIRKLQRLKRSLDSEQINVKLEDSNFPTEATSQTNPGRFTFSPPTTIENQEASNKKTNILNDDEIEKTHTANSEAELTAEFLSDKRENFDTFTKFQTTEGAAPSVENVKLIPNAENVQVTVEDHDRFHTPNSLKKDVETFVLKRNCTTENPSKPHTISLPQESNFPSLIEDIQSPLDHHIMKKAATYDADEVESFTPEYNVPRNVYRHRQRGRNDNQLEIIDEFSPQAGRLKSLIAFHLNGDTSQYVMDVHPNYKGNGHLRHAQKTFLDWKVSDWVDTISATHSFHFRNGVVTVKESGLYFIYAQIYYLDEHDANGYMVLRNSEILMQCKVTAPSSERQLKGNTCYTGGVVYLENNDKLSIDDIYNGRFTLFVPGKSFFGMIKLGDIKGK